MTLPFPPRRFTLALFTGLLVALLLMAAGRLCAATLVAPFYEYSGNMGGTTRENVWQGFSDETKPAGVGTGPAGPNPGKASQWSGGIISTTDSNYKFGPTTSSGTAAFPNEITDYIADASGGGIYNFTSLTHYSIASTSPLAGLETLIMQLYVGEGVGGSLTAAPRLTVNGTQTLTATYSQRNSHDPFNVFFPSYLDMLAYQWDLTAIVGPITSYTIDWQADMHGITYGADVIESTNAASGNILAVPEPSRGLFSLIAVLGLVLRRRRA